MVHLVIIGNSKLKNGGPIMSNIIDGNTETDSEKSNNKLSNFKEKITSILIWGATIFGIVAIGVAAGMPFFIKEKFLGTTNYKTYGDLGAIGDYIGGTTVAVLTAASVFLLLATILMQRREIKISQEGIKQLAEQTKASVKQAEEARKEAVITNETMARQQFETTFFNMIKLHSNLSENISYYGETGSKGIMQSFQFIKNNIINLANKKFPQIFKEEHDYEYIEDLIEQLQGYEYELVRNVNLEHKSEVITIFKKLNFEELNYHKIDNPIVHSYRKYSRSFTDEQLIQQAIKEFTKENGYLPVRHFNSFALIIGFLKNSQFELEDMKTGEDKNKIYREIFFSQLSSEEMVLIYYLAKYTSLNEWLLDELKAYNLFYPNLVKSLFLFGETDIINIERLSS